MAPAAVEAVAGMIVPSAITSESITCVATAADGAVKFLQKVMSFIVSPVASCQVVNILPWFCGIGKGGKAKNAKRPRR